MKVSLIYSVVSSIRDEHDNFMPLGQAACARNRVYRVSSIQTV